MIIGVVGTNASGKDTAAEFISKKLVWPALSMSDELRAIARNRGLGTDRSTLQKLGNELREEHGGDYISRLILEKYSDNFVVSSIRNPQEIDPFRKSGRFVLVMVNADAKVRYDRAKSRMRSDEDMVSFEEFIATEQYELDGAKDALRLKPVFDAADVTLENNGTYNEFVTKLEELVSKIKRQEVAS